MISRKFRACFALAVSAVLLAGCGGGGSDSAPSSGAGTAGSSGAASDPVRAAAQAKIAEFTTLPATFPGGTTPYDPGTGTAAVLVSGFAAAPSVQAANWTVEAFNAMGWQVGPPVDGQFSQNAQAAFIDRAVQDKLDGVVLVGVDVNNIKPSVDRAAAAGVRISCIVCTSGAQWQGKVVDVSPNWLKTGEIAGWKTLANSGGDAKVATFFDAQFAAVRLRTQGVQDTVKANCPSCTVDVINMTGADITKPGPPQWVAYLAAHPEGAVNNVIGEYDDISMVVTRTAASSGRQLLVGGYDGAVPNLTAMVKGTPAIDFSVAHPFNYEAWTAADVLARWKAGQQLPPGLDDMPNLLVTKDNAPQLLVGNPPGSFYPAPAGDWQGAFKKLWGKAAA